MAVSGKEKLKIAVIGSGGREHALVHALKKSPRCGEIYALPGNGGIAGEAACVPLKATDLEGVVGWCAQNRVDYVVVAPDNPLAMGMVDALAAKGIPAFGPNKAAARIEASKVFAKNLMRKYQIPTANYRSFDNSSAAIAHIVEQNQYPVVVKADGLALGKGVLICADEQAARDAVHSIMEDRLFGESGAQVVVEEFLSGPEVSVLAFCDGETLVPMVSSMDHKRAFDGDVGPNTGGMGAVAPNPFYTAETAARCRREIFDPTLLAMAAEGAPFSGCLYFGLILTQDGPKVIEYNCRFGDPETQVVLPLLESDLLEIMLACTQRRLAPEMVRFAGDEACACVVMASGGYPGEYKTGLPIEGLPQAAPGATVYHAGTALDAAGRVLTAGGRVLGVTARGHTLEAALQKAYAAVGRIQFEGAYWRRDIGQQALEALQKN